MTHLWLRAEHRTDESRAPLTPDGARQLVAAGTQITVEDSKTRVFATQNYVDAGCTIAPTGSWPSAPSNAVIFGLKELPDDATALTHRHIFFGHAFKGQPAGQTLLRRFRDGGGTLLDLEYLVNTSGTRVAAFGYWAGFAGAAVALSCWAAQQRGAKAGAVHSKPSAAHLLADLQTELLSLGTHRPTALVIGALGRVGKGASDLCRQMGVPVTKWDMAETAHGGPFPEVLAHDIFLNCILARPGTPVFVPANTPHIARRLSVIADIACDPDSDFSPIKVYDRTTTWDTPALRVHDAPPLDVTAIDNLPSMLPAESSDDFAAQLLPSLMILSDPLIDVWARALSTFQTHITRL
ncbi:MAG: saccharopine dehydrogenase [Sedimentitalea sp.]